MGSPISGHSFTEFGGGGIVRIEGSSWSEITRKLSIKPKASQVAGPMTISRLKTVVSTAARRRRPPSRNEIHSKTGYRATASTALQITIEMKGSTRRNDQ